MNDSSLLVHLLICYSVRGSFSLLFHFIPSSYDAIPNYIGMDNLMYFYGPDSVCSETWKAPIIIFNFLYFLCLSVNFLDPCNWIISLKSTSLLRVLSVKNTFVPIHFYYENFFKIWKILPWLTSLMLHKLIIYLVFPFFFLSYIVVWFLPPFLPCL